MQIAVLDSKGRESELVRLAASLMGHDCQAFRSEEQLLNAAAREGFQMFVLCDVAGFRAGPDILKALRRQSGRETPALLISDARSSWSASQAAGASPPQHLIRPVVPNLLRAQMESMLPCNPPVRSPGNCAFRQFRFDFDARCIVVRATPVSLLPTELKLAHLLMSFQGQLLSRLYLQERVWGASSAAISRALNTHISHLRTRLNIGPQTGCALTSVYGKGYLFEFVVADVVTEDGAGPS